MRLSTIVQGLFVKCYDGRRVDDFKCGGLYATSHVWFHSQTERGCACMRSLVCVCVCMYQHY